LSRSTVDSKPETTRGVVSHVSPFDMQVFLQGSDQRSEQVDIP
jgi:hypothetical protein